MARPKTSTPKIQLSLTINSELDVLLIKLCEAKNINKSKYIEYLIKKEMDKNANKPE